MSLFRTLQNSPGTISIFHNKKLPSLVLLYSILDKAGERINNDTTKFQVDVMTNKMPTFDQFQFLINNCAKDEAAKGFIRNAYPLVNPKKSTKEKNSTTIEPPKALRRENWKTFTEGEYAIVYDAFNQLVEDIDANPEHDPSEIFKAPLVVDWDQCIVAGDEHSLEEILDKYRTKK